MNYSEYTYILMRIEQLESEQPLCNQKYNELQQLYRDAREYEIAQFLK